MQKFTFTLINSAGLHARPAAQFVSKIKDFSSEICLCAQGKKVNAKNLFSVLGLDLQKGDTIELRAEGEDELQVIAAVRMALETLN